MRFLVMLEQTKTGFAVQAPDLAIATYGENIEAAKRAASEAIRINLEAYREAGQQAPEGQSVSKHLDNPEFRDLLFGTSTWRASGADRRIGNGGRGPFASRIETGYAVHGLMTSTPQCWKSAVFRVATAARWTRAIAAIMSSNWDVGRPAASRAATIFANAPAAS